MQIPFFSCDKDVKGGCKSITYKKYPFPCVCVDGDAKNCEITVQLAIREDDPTYQGAKMYSERTVTFKPGCRNMLIDGYEHEATETFSEVVNADMEFCYIDDTGKLVYVKGEVLDVCVKW